MNLAEYRDSGKAFSNHLRGVEPIGNGIVRLRPNGYGVGFEFRGPDTLGCSWYDLRARCDMLAQILAQCDSSWCFHISVQRLKGAMYPKDGFWPHPMVYLLDQARRGKYEEYGDHYLSVSRLWVSWYPANVKGGLLDFLYNDRDNLLNPLQKFEQHIASLEASLRPFFYDFERLQTTKPYTLLSGEPVMSDEIASSLIEEFYGQKGLIAGDTSMETRYDTMLSPSWVDLKPSLALDGRHIGVVSVLGYPQFVYPSMLDDLRGLPVDLRFTTRIIPYSIPQAEGKLHAKSATHLLSSLGLGLFMNKKGEGDDGDATALSFRKDVKDSMNDVNSGVAYGQTNPKVIIYGDSAADVREAEGQIRDEMRRMRMHPRIEDSSNRLHAYLCSLPWEPDADEILGPPLPLAGALRLAPTTSLWHGPEKHPDKRFGENAGPVLTMTTPMMEAFRLFLHVGQNGHTKIVARTGRGKSVLLRALEIGHLSRYAGARALVFDIGRSAYKIAQVINGRHYMPHAGKVPQIAFLSGLDDPAQFEDVANDVYQLLELWLDRRLSVDEIDDVTHALQSTAGLKPFRLSDVGRSCQGKELRTTFEQFRDSMLDAYEDDFDFNALAGTPYWCFEIGLLGVDKPRWTVPFISYVQRRAFYQFTQNDSAPTMVVVDEAARALKIPRVEEFAERMERESRKNRGQFVFATQSADEILKSNIASVLIEQTATTITGANRELVRSNTRLREQYMQIGYSEEACDIVSTLGEYDVLVSNEYGLQVVALAPLSVELALYGGASTEDCDAVDRLIAIHGKNFVSAYLRERRDLVGLEEFAQVIDTLRGAWSARQRALEEAV